MTQPHPQIKKRVVTIEWCFDCPNHDRSSCSALRHKCLLTKKRVSGIGCTPFPKTCPLPYEDATHTPAAQAPDTLVELKITQEMLYEFCEWFCDHNVDCSEAPCNISVSRLHERLEGIMKQMKDHPEYLAKWDVKRAEQESLRGGAP